MEQLIQQVREAWALAHNLTGVGASNMDCGSTAVDPGSTVMDPGAAVVDLGSASADPGAASVDPGAAVVDPVAAAVDPGTAALDPIGAAAVDPGDTAVDSAHGRDHTKLAGSQLQPGSQNGAACSLGGSPGYLPAVGGGSSSRAGSVRVCAGCGDTPSTGAKLQAHRPCMSVRYCSAECQAKHWREGGHKEACPRLHDIRARKRAAGGGG